MSLIKVSKYRFQRKHIIFFMWMIFISLAGSQVKAKAAQMPVRIRSDIMDIKQKSNSIEFLKNVAIEKETSSLTADRMTVIYNLKKNGENLKKNGEDQSSSKSEIKQIDAIGNVKIFSEEFVASGNQGHYSPKQNTFTLKENVIVNNGTSIASGEEFIYNISTKKGEFIGKKSDTISKSKTSQSVQNDQKLNFLSKEKQGEIEGDERITVIINEEVENKNLKSKKVKPSQNSR